MLKRDNIRSHARDLCASLFGLAWDELPVNSYPHIASYYVAKQMLAGEDNIFRSLARITLAVHNYNRNLATTIMREVTDERSKQEAREAISRRSITVSPGGPVGDRVFLRASG